MRGISRRLTVAALGASVALATAGAPAAASDSPPGRRLAGARVAAAPPAGRQAAALRAALAGTGTARLAVTLRPGADADAVVAAARGHGATERRRIPQIGVVSVEVPAAAAARVAAALARRPDVRAVEPVRARAPHHVPNDADYAAQPYLAEVNAPAAWDLSKGAADVLVAVVDSGVDVTHPDLAGKVAGSFNAVTGTTSVTDAAGHGTFVAGVAAAATNNAAGIAGAGYDARVLAVKVAAADQSISTDDEAEGIVWAADNGADVINISLGGPAPDTAEANAVAYAVGKGAIVVASAGNENTDAPSYPAAYDNVIAVGATTGADRSTFSNHGSWVDVGAPGTGIRSLAPGGGYATSQGTSFSSPLVAGEVALLRAAHPTVPAATIRAAVSAATTGSYGFAAGRVDFAGAFANLVPVSAPTLTAPESLATIAGDAAVSAASGAEQVRFSVNGGPSATVNVVEGVASATLETFGLSGARTVTAVNCNSAGCGTASDTRSVTVDNGVPTVTGPAAGTEVGTASFAATATTPAGLGGVRFLVDGVAAGFDGTAPYEAAIGTSALSEGAHALTAVLCNRAGTVCDTANPSAAVSFTVKSLHPAVTSVAPSPFSPNADGKLDTTTVTYTLDVAQSVALAIRNAGGTVVRGGSLGTRPAGASTWVWNGKSAAGAALPDGVYTVEIATSKGDLTGFASRTVKLDKTAPVLSSVSGHGATFYPVKDGYKDTFSAAVTLGESARLILTVYNSAGQAVRVIDAGVKAPGRHAVAWNGRRSDGTLLPAGTYRYAFTARDAAQNTRVTGRYTVYTSAKRLTAKTATKVLSPNGTRTGVAVGACSAWASPARSDWAGSIGWYSDYHCYDPWTAYSDLAVTEHAFTLPSAVKYGSVRIAATGERAVSGYNDIAALVLLDPGGSGTDWGATLGAAYGTYWTPGTAAANVLDGRTVRWIGGTIEGHWYRVRSFTLRWTYYVLI